MWTTPHFKKSVHNCLSAIITEVFFSGQQQHKRSINVFKDQTFNYSETQEKNISHFLGRFFGRKT